MKTNKPLRIVTDGQIDALRKEAAQAGDLEQVRLCEIALGYEEYEHLPRPERLAARHACADAIL